jgi:hypothetical protein
MRIKKLRRKVRQQARLGLLTGKMSERDYDAAIWVANSDTLLNKLNDRIEAEVNPWKRADGLIGTDWNVIWANLIDWFKANWPTILRIILTIVLIMETNKDEDS